VTKLPWFSCLLWHSPGNEVGLFYNTLEPTRIQPISWLVQNTQKS